MRACVPRARTSSFEVVHGRKIGKHVSNRLEYYCELDNRESVAFDRVGLGVAEV